MKTLSLYLAILNLLWMGCQQKSPNIPVTVEEKQELLEAVQLTTKDYITTSSDYLVYPIYLNQPENSTRLIPNEKKRVFDSYGYDTYNRNLPINLLFYNIETQERHYLFAPNPAIIANHSNVIDYYKKIEKQDEVLERKQLKTRPGKLFFEIINKNANGNGFIDYNDSKALFMSDSLGRGLVQLTPAFMDVKSWEFPFPEKDKLQVKTLVDGNQNGSFDLEESSDYEQILIIDINKPKEYVVVLDTTAMKAYKEQLLH